MKRKPNRKGKHSHAKTVLRLPDLEVAKAAVINGLSCPYAQRGYRQAIDEFVDWYCSETRLSFSKTVVVRYRMHLESRHLAPGTINLRLGAVRRLAYEAADYGLLTRGLGCGNTACQGREEAWCQVGQSVNTRAGKSALAGTRSRAAPRQARPCPPGNSSGLWSPAA